MVDVDKSMLSLYLNVDKEKYESKGVDSVRSRVCNLKDLNSDITVASVKEAMIRAFESVYGAPADVYEYGGKQTLKDTKELGLSAGDSRKIKESAEFFGSDEWLFKNNIKFNVRFHERFDFGDLDLRFFVDKGVIKKGALYSDAMDETAFLNMALRIEALSGSDYSPEVIKAAIGDDKISGRLLL